MDRFALFAIAFSAITIAPSSTFAQPVTASPEAVQSFVDNFATPTRLTGKVARWEDGVCPRTVGQPPAIANIVNQRVKDLAAFVGAPVHESHSCTPNVEIIFTSAPQELLKNVRDHDANFLGFTESSAERDRVATVTRPIQAWYTTLTRDLRGLSRIDSARRPGQGMTMSCFTCRARSSGSEEYLPHATYANVTGSRVSDGVRSAFHHILIVADPSKLQDYGIGPLADYIALLALTQINSLDSCQALPSIENMLAPGCAPKTQMLTINDAAFLRGLYKMSPERRLFATQKSEIADGMRQMLAERRP